MLAGWAGDRLRRPEVEVGRAEICGRGRPTDECLPHENRHCHLRSRSDGPAPGRIEAAQVQWHSQHGPDDVANALALCSLHRTVLDLGVLSLTEDREDPGLRTVRRPQRGRPGSGPPGRAAVAAAATAPARCRHRLHRPASPAGIQRQPSRTGAPGRRLSGAERHAYDQLRSCTARHCCRCPWHGHDLAGAGRADTRS
jgi:hypothetical protein